MRAGQAGMNRRARLLATFAKAGYRRGGAFTVIEHLAFMADSETLIIPDHRQPTLAYLAYRCGMSERTLTWHLSHLGKHGVWVTRIRGGGDGNPTRYELHFGTPCDCRPVLVPGAERTRRWRENEKKKWEASL
jgi:hypothetical protein